MACDGVARDALVRQLDTLLESQRFRDYCPNGLQIEGGDQIRSLATACTASRAAINEACALGADALLVHHGILWKQAPLPISGMLKQRVAPLLAADCSLIAYHLPLDAHPQVGNNAVLLELLQFAQPPQPFAEYHGQTIGLFVDCPHPLAIGELRERLAKAVDHAVLHCPGDGDQVQRIGVVTGGGQSLLLEAAAAGCQLLITGEASEQTWHEARESGCHCLAAGHHATEDIAVHRLGAQLAAEHGLHHHPIHIANPI